MRTKIGLLSILTAVLLAFGGVAVAQDYGTEPDPQDTTTGVEATASVTDEDQDGDLDANADVDVQNDAVGDDQYADDEMGDDDELPRTASFLPALGALGLMTLAGGAALGARKS